MVDRMVGRVLQVRIVEPGQFEQVAHGQHAGDLEDVVLLVQFQFRGQPAPVHRVIPAITSIRTMGANLRSRSSDSIIASRSSACSSSRLGIGVAGYPEQFTGHDLHPGEEQVEIAHHHLFQPDKAVPVPHPDEAGDAGAHRHLDPGQGAVGLLG